MTFFRFLGKDGKMHSLICQRCAPAFFGQNDIVPAASVDPIENCWMCGGQASELLDNEIYEIKASAYYKTQNTTNKMNNQTFDKPFPKLDPIQTKLKEVYTELAPVYSECCEAQGGHSLGGNPPKYCPACGDPANFFKATYFERAEDRYEDGGPSL